MADLYARQYYLPKSVANLKRKMEALEAEARELRHKDIVTCLEAANRAWDREVELAKLAQELRRKSAA